MADRTWKDVTLGEMMTELRREIAMRKRVYPQWVNSRKMKRETATEQQFRLIASLKQIERLRVLEDVADEMAGRKTHQVELGIDDGSFLSKLKALMAEAPNPRKHWLENEPEAQAIYALLIRETPRWSDAPGH